MGLILLRTGFCLTVVTDHMFTKWVKTLGLGGAKGVVKK